MKALIPVILLVGCGSYDEQLYGANLIDDSHTVWSVRDDLKPRMRMIIEKSAKYWDVDPVSVSGYDFHLVPDVLHECGLAHGDFAGCTAIFVEMKVATMDRPCIELTSFVHELGHIFRPMDNNHSDPLWHQFDNLWPEIMDDPLVDKECKGFARYPGVWDP